MALTVLKHVVIGHVPIELSFITNCFLQMHPDNFKITGPRRLKNGLAVSGKFTAFTKSAAIGQKLKEQLTHIKELCKHKEIEITGSDLRERTYSPVLMLL